MSGRVRGVGGAFWLTGTLFFSAIFISLFRIVPWYFSQTEPRYMPPTSLPQGRIFLRNDEGGEGHFGASRSNNRTHTGIDIAAAMNEPVFASKSGRIAYAGPKGGYGNFVQILHPGGWDTRYAHLSTIEVTPGAWVGKGEMIGRIGKTGNANSRIIDPHLHFEIRRDDAAQNPFEWIAEEGSVS